MIIKKIEMYLVHEDVQEVSVQKKVTVVEKEDPVAAQRGKKAQHLKADLGRTVVSRDRTQRCFPAERRTSRTMLYRQHTGMRRSNWFRRQHLKKISGRRESLLRRPNHLLRKQKRGNLQHRRVLSLIPINHLQTCARGTSPAGQIERRHSLVQIRHHQSEKGRKSLCLPSPRRKTRG